MDEALKARLIGAAVLVALAVLLIPELLSGRKAVEPVAEEGAGPRGNRTFTIELGAGANGATRTPTTVAAAPVPGPAPAVPAVASTPSSEPSADPATQTPPESAAQPSEESAAQAVAQEPAARPEARRSLADELAETQAAPATVAGRGGWAVQVGAFSSADTADRLVSELSGAGFQAYVSPIVRSGKTLHRVRVGREADKAGAERLVPGLKARGLPATVVQND